MQAERQSKKRGDEILPHSATYTLHRASALEQVLNYFNLPFRRVANEGAPYPDGNAKVPKGGVFVTYDTGEISAGVIWRMVDEIAPIPMVDGKR